MSAVLNIDKEAGILETMKRKAYRAALIFCVIFAPLGIVSFSVSVNAAAVIPNDPLFARQSYLSQIHAPQAWTLMSGSSSTVVAVLDSGLDMAHPDLKDALWMNEDEIPGDGIDNDSNGYIDDVHGWDFINDIPDPKPKFGGDFLYAGIHHGTLIAGIIAARGDNGFGIAGVSWHTKIMPLRVLTNQGEGNVFDVVRAIDYAIGKRVDIINLSFLGTEESTYLRSALRRALDAGVIVVTAAGNNESGKKGFNLDEEPVYPACFNDSLAGVIAVGSVDALGQKAPFSNYGSCIDVIAPGIDLYSTQAVNYERFGFDHYYGGGWSGTSLSTALVTGVIALMKSANPSLSPTEIAALFQTNCDSVDDLNPHYKKKLGCGRLNAARLVRAAQDIRISHDDKSKKKLPRRVVKSVNLGITPSDGRGEERFFSSASGTQLFPNIPSSKESNVKMILDRIVVDVDNDGEQETITAPKSGRGPLKITSARGVLRASVYPYGASYAGGLSFAVGDLNANGKKEIVIVPRTRAPAHVMILNNIGKVVGTFFASPKNARNGFLVRIIP